MLNKLAKERISGGSPLEPAPLDLLPVTRQGVPIQQHADEDRHRPVWTSLLRRNMLFVVTVLVPTFLAIVYYTLIAADQYVSEARFVVRSASSGGALGGLGVLGALGGTGQSNNLASVTTPQSLTKANDDTYSVNEYIASRDAVARLKKENGLLDIFSRSEADFINSFPNFYSPNNLEYLYRHYQWFIDVSMQSETGISVLEVRTFRPEDSRDLALALLQHAEELVNKLNNRAREDAVRFAESVVKKAEQRIFAIQDTMTEFRNREMIIDPGKQSEATLELMARLTSEAAVQKAQLDLIKMVTPDSPQIEPLRSRIRSMEEQISQQRAQIAGGDQSMVQKLSQFEQISLNRELAVKQLTSALVSLENSRQEAQRQQLYLERVVEPNLPDYPLYPRRLLSILIVFAVSMCVFLSVRAFRTAVLEH